MKIQIDFENKVITLLEKISLAELMIELKYRFPDKEWKEYSLDFIYRKYRLYPTLPNPIPDPYIPPFKITCGIVTPVQKVTTSATNDITSKYMMSNLGVDVKINYPKPDPLNVGYK